jgi:hypothetical protein
MLQENVAPNNTDRWQELPFIYPADVYQRAILIAVILVINYHRAILKMSFANCCSEYTHVGAPVATRTAPSLIARTVLFKGVE